VTPVPSSPLRPKQVLIVDDDEDLREVLGDLLLALGHRALQASTAMEAVECAQQNTLDVALIDLGLPGDDGYEVARRIRNTMAGAGIRLVALTGSSDELSRRSAEAAGFDDFLVKPAGANAIVAAVDGPFGSPAP
jgi:CheY-like chemotaxis protein